MSDCCTPKNTQGCCSPKGLLAQKISFKSIDYFKAFYSWIFAFRRTFIIEPGLYYTGERYNRDTPLLVTCNYHMTVFLLWRILKNRSIRLLVIDTKGINVWCSSGKGQFCAKEIIKQIEKYDRKTLSVSETISLILPKLSLSGVSIAELKRNSIDPQIGPVYGKELPEYLDDIPFKDRVDDRFKFSMKDRLFTLIPSLVQFSKYAIYIGMGLFVWDYFFKTDIYWQVIPISMVIAVMYIIFFPLLPTKTFALKGLFLCGLQILGLCIFYFLFNENSMDQLSFLFYLFLLCGANLFFPLYYTGNSGVSNYSLVKKEIIRYLPVSAVFLMASIITIIIKGVAP